MQLKFPINLNLKVRHTAEPEVRREEAHELSERELLVLQAFRQLADRDSNDIDVRKFLTRHDADSIFQPLQRFVIFLRERSIYPLKIMKPRVNSPDLTKDEKLLFDLIAGAQCGFGCYCGALLRLLVNEEDLALARNVCTDLGVAMALTDITIRNKLCTDMCDNMGWTHSACTDQGRNLIH